VVQQSLAQRGSASLPYATHSMGVIRVFGCLCQLTSIRKYIGCAISHRGLILFVRCRLTSCRAGLQTQPGSSHVCCRTLPGGADAQQQGLQAEISRLAPLKEVSSVSSMAPSLNGTSAQQHHPKQPQSLPQGDISDFFEPLPSQRLDPYFRSGSIRSRPSMAGGLSRRASVEGGRTAREGGVRGRLGGAARPTSTPTYV